jgi:hypothetical protein
MMNLPFIGSLSGLVAFRGLWDKFAPPCSLGAYQRAFLKGVPFLLDLQRGEITLEAVVSSGILKSASLPLFVITDDLQSVGEILANYNDFEALFVVVRSESSLLSIHSLESGQVVKCGLYVPLKCSSSGQYPEKELGEAVIVLFESVNTQLVLTGEKSCGAVDDLCIEQKLLSLLSSQAKLFKVSDLVERELFMRGHGRKF